jgi:hypothetical protein
MLRSRAPVSGTEPPRLSEAGGELGPAVVNHVGRAGAVDGSAAPAGSRAAPGEVDASADAEVVRQLRARDAEVRAHERAHAATAGALAGATSYEFERGPDGRSYAVSGEVQIDMSVVSGDAEATIRKMQQVKRAALAPQSPSDADRAIAAQADAAISAARRELSSTGSQERPEEGSPIGTANGPVTEHSAHDAFSAYERRNAGAAMYQNGSPAVLGDVIDVVS